MASQCKNVEQSFSACGPRKNF